MTTWGYAGPWYFEFTTHDGDNPEDPAVILNRRLDFLAEHNLTTTGYPLQSFANLPEQDREQIARRLQDEDLALTCHVGCRYLSVSDDEAAAYNEKAIALLDRYLPMMRSPIATISKGPGHRFDLEQPLEEQLARLARGFAPVARACHERNIPLGIENHGDYYCSDLVQLCESVPHLYIFLDTGNTYLIGERPLPAFEVAAPYVIGTHFKDHIVEPVARGLHFDIHGAPLGQGHVPLRACYRLLKQHAPFPDDLVMQMEMICPKDDGITPPECLERSLAFVRSL